MNKPHIICYMMTSVDGRIDCAMTSNLPGVEDYYPLLDELKFDAVVSGKTTARLELAEPGQFTVKNPETVEEDIISKKVDSTNGYNVVVDTKGTLLWKSDNEYDQPHVIITSQQVTKEYLSYLDERNISYIVAGVNTINLAKASEILADIFGVKKMGIVGGPTINTAFLDAGLLDEVIILVGAGIDGRASYPPVFNRTEVAPDVPTRMKLEDVRKYDSGAVMLQYSL